MLYLAMLCRSVVLIHSTLFVDYRELNNKLHYVENKHNSDAFFDFFDYLIHVSLTVWQFD